ncbi:hypothetical protein ASPCAL10207 [Aspergillus calidoustus]|uniref:Uncharacterized protein n=1 Tax=Aspergillus calidoustus TaxID=454130 RepID=A0A0U5G4P3_ASPCI|nr:hypothetical protein ASPCAL10207 [Aspergillus calidoustus]
MQPCTEYAATLLQSTDICPPDLISSSCISSLFRHSYTITLRRYRIRFSCLLTIGYAKGCFPMKPLECDKSSAPQNNRSVVELQLEQADNIRKTPQSEMEIQRWRFTILETRRYQNRSIPPP